MPGLLRRLLELLAAGAVAEALALVEEEAVVRRRPAATPPPAAPAAAGHRLVRVASRESDQHDRYADSGEAVAVLDQLPVAWLRGTAAAARNEPIPRVGHDTGAGTPPHALQPPSSGRRQAARDNNISPNLTSPKPEPTASDEQAAEAVHAAQVLGFFMADYFRNHTQLMLVPRRLAAELAPAYHWLDEWRGRTVAHAAIKSAARAAADRGWTVARAAELLLLAGDYEPAVGFLVDVGAWPVAFEVAFALSSVVHAEWPHELLHELLQSLAANSAQQVVCSLLLSTNCSSRQALAPSPPPRPRPLITIPPTYPSPPLPSFRRRRGGRCMRPAVLPASRVCWWRRWSSAWAS